MKTLKILLPIICLVILFDSCSEEQKFYRKLIGTWDIITWDAKYYDNDTLVGQELFADYGTIELRDDETGTIILNDPSLGEITHSIIDWTNTLDEITLTLDFAGGANIDKYQITSNNNTRQTWELDETNINPSTQVRERDVKILSLKKR